MLCSILLAIKFDCFIENEKFNSHHEFSFFRRYLQLHLTQLGIAFLK